MQWEIFTKDVEMCLKGKTKWRKTQKILGFDIIFRGFIAKDWYSNNQNCEKYAEHNKVIVKACVDF